MSPQVLSRHGFITVRTLDGISPACKSIRQISKLLAKGFQYRILLQNSTGIQPVRTVNTLVLSSSHELAGGAP
jgi:hypothetical protein